MLTRQPFSHSLADLRGKASSAHLPTENPCIDADVVNGCHGEVHRNATLLRANRENISFGEPGPKLMQTFHKETSTRFQSLLGIMISVVFTLLKNVQITSTPPPSLKSPQSISM